MPLEIKFKISLNHKKRKKKNKVMIDTSIQEVPKSASFSGSLTVEAALVFPIFLFMLLAFLFFFRVLQVQQIMEEALAVAGSRTSLEVSGEEEDSQILYASALAYFNVELTSQGLPAKFISGGRVGISFQESDFEGEYIDLFINYKLKLPTGFFGKREIPIVQRVRMKKWNGYHGDGAEAGEGEWVYITPNGSVYHRSRECTHLRLSISSIPAQSVSDSSYSPCELCGKSSNSGGLLYITNQGRRYHSRLSCSGLKRTVYMIRLSKAGNRNGCQRCGG